MTSVPGEDRMIRIPGGDRMTKMNGDARSRTTSVTKKGKGISQGQRGKNLSRASVSHQGYGPRVDIGKNRVSYHQGPLSRPGLIQRKWASQ